MDPMKTGSPVYARRLLSSPGRKDGSTGSPSPGEPQSPLGPAVARAQADGNSPDGHYGYYSAFFTTGRGGAGRRARLHRERPHYGRFRRHRLAGALWRDRRDDLHRRLQGEVYQQDLGPETAQKAGMINIFNPDKGWVESRYDASVTEVAT